MEKHTKLRFIGILLASTCMPIIYASAQETHQSEEPALMEIVVTATKTHEKLTDVPISVTSVSSGKIASRGIVDTSQLEKIIPGFTYQPSTFGAPVFYIRGVGFYETTLAVSPAVSIYVDQVPIPFSTMARGVALDLERLEALKGPQGTLFGQNATGGAINYIAAKPTQVLSIGADISYGRFNDVKVGGFASGPLSDTLSVRAAARHDSRDAWQNSSSRNDKLGKRDFTTGRLTLDWGPTDLIRTSFVVSGWRDQSETQASQFIGYRINVPCPGPGYQPACDSAVAQPISPQNSRAADWTPNRSYSVDDNFYQFAFTAEADLTDTITLTSLSAYSHFDSIAPVDTDGMAYLNQSVVGNSKIHSFSQELRLSGELGNFGNWMLGGNYQRDVSEELQTVALGSSNSASFRSLQISDNQHVSSKAVFGSVNVPLGEKFKVSASVRYTDENRDFDGCVIDVDGGLAGTLGAISNLRRGLPPFPPEAIAQGDCATLSGTTSLPAGRVMRSLDENNLSFRVSVSYKPDDDSLLYTTVSKGYKSGSFPLLPGLFDSQYQPATQESVLAYEAGLKTSLLDRRVQFNSAIYYYNYSDKQVRGFVDVGSPFGNVPVLVNVPNSRAWGFEAELRAAPTRGLILSAAINYLKSKVTRTFLTPDPLGDIYDIKGENFPSAPQWQLSGDIEYRFDLVDGDQIYVGASPSYRTSTKSAFGPNPILAIKGYALLDLRLGFESENNQWLVEVYGRNVTNKYYWTLVTREIDAITRTTGMPATYGIRASFKY